MWRVIMSLFGKKPGVKPTKKRVAATGGGGLIAISAAGLLSMDMLIKPWEGRVYVPYKDVGGIWTVCDGHTGPDIVLGKIYTDAECDVWLQKDVAKHEHGLDRCINDDIEIPDHTKAAFISYTFNVGVGAACKSTLVRKVNAGDLQGGCDQLSRWVFVNGKKVQGLVNRRVAGDDYRISERTLCLIGLDPAYETPLYEKLIIAFNNAREGM